DYFSVKSKSGTCWPNRKLGAILRSIDSRVRRLMRKLDYITLERGIMILGYRCGMGSIHLQRKLQVGILIGMGLIIL
ncbi:MAG TPA: hypothetical protein PLN76_13775, partial [Saprospiraceae bacterium]|nr:hypothetical protein [Saprospiraceae bacterium]